MSISSGHLRYFTLPLYVYALTDLNHIYTVACQQYAFALNSGIAASQFSAYLSRVKAAATIHHCLLQPRSVNAELLQRSLLSASSPRDCYPSRLTSPLIQPLRH